MNVGAADKKLRLIAGAVLIVIAFALLGGLSSTVGLLATLIGLVLVVTGFFNFCPVYKLLGLNTHTK